MIDDVSLTKIIEEFGKGKSDHFTRASMWKVIASIG